VTLQSGVLASALIRRVNDAGGFAVVRAKGDAESGQILLLLAARDGATRVLERGIGPSGASELMDTTPADSDPESLEAYWRRRRARDPDLWVLELDIPDAERFAAETLLQH
jgi:hypothetical protein